MTENKKIGVGFGVMLIKDNKILLGKRHDDPEKADSLFNGAGTWTMPGGKSDFGETFETGAKREVVEETGIRLGQVDVICINQDIVEGAHFVTIGLICEEFSGEPKVMEPDEITQWEWFDLSNLPNPLYFPTAKILKNYTQKKFYIAELSKV
jgi:8-oxo-dGTP diphosphatase